MLYGCGVGTSVVGDNVDKDKETFPSFLSIICSSFSLRVFFLSLYFFLLSFFSWSTCTGRTQICVHIPWSVSTRHLSVRVRACGPRQTKLNQSLHQNSCSHASGTHDKKYGDPNQQQSINNDFVQIRVSPVWGSRQQGVDWETPRSWSASIGGVFIAHTFY